MSQTNRESTEDIDTEPSEGSSESSSTSSCCTPSTTTSTSSGSDDTSSSNSEATVTGTSDPETNEGDCVRHRQCQSFTERHDDETNQCNVLRQQRDQVIACSLLTTGQFCDIRPKATNCPSTAKVQSRNQDQVRQPLCPGKSRYETVSPPLSNTPPTLQPETSELKRIEILDKDTQSHLLLSHVLHSPSKKVNVIERRATKFNRGQQQTLDANTTSTSPPYSSLGLSTSSTSQEELNEAEAQSARCMLKPVPSPSPSLSAIDPNNNKSGQNSSSSRAESLSGLRRTNFSKSASGSRLVNKTATRPNVCDCLEQNCRAKEHSNRRQFIEHYYNSRTRLPSANTMSSFNIYTPLNRLSECDAITKRLLSSPIRTTNPTESPTRRAQITDVDKSRRASLGTNTITDQVFLFSSNQFNSLELNYRKSLEGKNADDNQQTCDSSTEDANLIGENDVKLKQQQGRSLSVCDEETLKPRYRKTNSNHSSNLNRAVSLACESGSSKRLLTIIPLFGCDIKALEQFIKLGLILPPAIDSAVDYIIAYGIHALGIFRKSGVKSRILTLRQRIESNQDVKIDELNKNNEFSIYDIADLVKMWFREIKPTPLMTKELIRLISDFLQTNHQALRNKSKESGNSSQDKSSSSKKNNSSTTRQAEQDLKNQINSLLTPTHRALFSRALRFLAAISSESETNQMTSQNLAICLTPSLCATESDQNSITTAQRALEFCIDNYRALF